ncbi:DUF6588 family protein [uncultured Croceitalea sp.]|uniref:DUF6588 family protein n=1 Tax=uncultured Croceitalea sp. TaxID=1798908 RepID=UPI0033057805
MKRIVLFSMMCSFSLGLMAQSDFSDVFAAGVEDTERFANDYFGPLSEAAIFSMGNGWYNSADAKPLGGFEISLIGNITGFKNKGDKKAFFFDEANYTNLQLVGGSDARTDTQLVSSALGDIEGVRVFVEAEVGPGLPAQRQEFELPSGLASEGLNFVPTAYLQASLGLIKGLEVKARFLPNINFDDDVEFGLFGAGLQYDFTKILPGDKILPVAISAVIGYTNLNASYDFTDQGILAGEDQRIETTFNTWTFAAVASTRLPIINFYGGFGYITGNSTTDVLGNYTAGIGPLSETVTDPFSIEREASGVTANVGTKLKLGFFRLNVDYTIAEFSTLTAGINFGFR